MIQALFNCVVDIVYAISYKFSCIVYLVAISNCFYLTPKIPEQANLRHMAKIFI